LAISRRVPAFSTTIESRRRSKSNGISSTFVYRRASACSGCCKIAVSSGLRIPVSNLLFKRAKNSGASAAQPSASHDEAKAMTP